MMMSMTMTMMVMMMMEINEAELVARAATTCWPDDLKVWFTTVVGSGLPAGCNGHQIKLLEFSPLLLFSWRIQPTPILHCTGLYHHHHQHRRSDRSIMIMTICNPTCVSERSHRLTLDQCHLILSFIKKIM